jgi:hypothetical protein
MGLQLEFMASADAVIEEIFLPGETESSDLPDFRAPDDEAHVSIKWKHEEGVQVIRYQEEEMAVPSGLAVIETG